MGRAGPHRCSIKGCTSTRRYNKIYNFPQNVIQRRKWVEIICCFDREFSQKHDSELMELGVCNKHFLPDQFFENGKRKANSFPNKFIQLEGEDGAPSYDAGSDGEENSLKRKLAPGGEKCDIISDVEIKKLKTEQKRKKGIQLENEEVCRLCLAMDVKMFSLESEPFKQYFKFIEPCIDEFEVLRTENFPKTVCYMCANSLRYCYEFGKICAHSQTVLTEFYLIYSKIDTNAIKEYDKRKLRLNYRLEEYSLPSISIDPSITRSKEEIQNVIQKPKMVAPNIINIATKSSPQPVNIHKDNNKRILNQNFTQKQNLLPKMVAPNMINNTTKISPQPVHIDKDNNKRILNQNFIHKQNILPKMVAPNIINIATESSPQPVYIDKDNNIRKLMPLQKNVVPVILNTYKGCTIGLDHRINDAKKMFCNIKKNFGYKGLETPQQTQEVVIDDDEQSVEYLDEEVLRESETDVIASRLKDYYEKVNLSVAETETIDLIPPNIEHSVKTSTSGPKLDASNKTQNKSTQKPVLYNDILSKHNVLLYKSDSIGSTLPKNPSVNKGVDAEKSSADEDDLVFVDATDAQKEPVKETPILSESTIEKLKKILLKEHGEVKVKRMFHEDGAIKVIMVNNKGKPIMLKLSVTDNLQPSNSKLGNSQPGNSQPENTQPGNSQPGISQPSNSQPGNSQPVNSQLDADKPEMEPPKETVTEIKFDKECWDIKVLTEQDQCEIIKNRQWTQTFLKAPFKCATCFKSFQSSNHYDQHIKRHDPKSGQFFCRMCKMYFVNAKRLLNHQRTHKMLYNCKLCEATFRSILTAKDHQKAHLVYQCNVCEEEFRFECDYDKHVNEHLIRTPNRYSHDHLKPHIKYGPYAAQKPEDSDQPRKYSICCGESFDCWQSHKKHVAETHPEQIPESTPLTEQPAMCDICGKIMRSKFSLYSHRKTHEKPQKDKEPHKCNVCGKISSTAFMNKEHMMSHTDERPHLCFKCARAFRKGETLKAHLLKCGTPEQESSDRKKFPCETCGRKFFKNSSLKAHILAAHTGALKHKQAEWRNNSQNKASIELED